MIDKEIEELINKEKVRQEGVVNLIASENYVSDDVLEALGSILTNKYAEGYSAMRYYGGNEVVDEIENLTKERALKLFKLSPDEWHVNVQALSGSPANVAIYSALVPFGGKIMGLELSHGGHLSHGYKVSFTGKMWAQVPYGVSKDTEQLDYDELTKISAEEKPQIVVAGFSAYPRTIDFGKFREVADAADTYLLSDMSHFAGLVAAGEHPSPFPHSDVVMTTTHKTLRGPRAALIFARKDDRELHKKIDKAVFPGFQGGPHLNQIAAVGVALKEAMSPEFRKYAKQVVLNASKLADVMRQEGFRLVAGGTDTHVLMIDIWNDGKGIGGQEASDRLERNKIIVNKNTIPFETRSPVDPSGIRMGTAAETTRGKKEKDMEEIGGRISEILKDDNKR